MVGACCRTLRQSQPGHVDDGDCSRTLLALLEGLFDEGHACVPLAMLAARIEDCACDPAGVAEGLGSQLFKQQYLIRTPGVIYKRSRVT